jgi:hypothetical protein
MSATMTPPAPADTTQIARPALAPVEIRTEPTPSSRVARSSPAPGRVSETLFFAVWSPAMVVAGVAGAVALAVATPVIVAQVLYRQRRYR